MSSERFTFLMQDHHDCPTSAPFRSYRHQLWMFTGGRQHYPLFHLLGVVFVQGQLCHDNTSTAEHKRRRRRHEIGRSRACSRGPAQHAADPP
jgi:hypothetical protein